jgi:hypothetical protein
MIIVKIQGGLGNQLFQYATGRNLAFKNNTELKLDLSDFKITNYRSYLLNNFNIEETIANDKEIEKYTSASKKIINYFLPDHKKIIIRNANYTYNSHIVSLGKNVYLDGYWQNQDYFAGLSDIIRKEFTLKRQFNVAEQDLLNKINSANSVAVHIRRSDYLSSAKFSKIYPALDLAYYSLAIELLSKKIKDPIFFVFSDEIAWAKKNLNLHDATYVSKNNWPDFVELILMSKCRHHIIANSSFSWWGAWLNQNPEKIVIGPNKWFKFCDDDRGIMPEGWIKI